MTGAFSAAVCWFELTPLDPVWLGALVAAVERLALRGIACDMLETPHPDLGLLIVAFRASALHTAEQVADRLQSSLDVASLNPRRLLLAGCGLADPDLTAEEIAKTCDAISDCPSTPLRARDPIQVTEAVETRMLFMSPPPPLAAPVAAEDEESVWMGYV